MLDFQKPQLSDKAWIDDLLRYSDYRGSEYNFTNLFIWNSVYGQQVARAGDFLLVRACGKSGCSYFYPAGRGDAREAIELLLLVGHYDMLATTLMTLRLEPDAHR